MKNLKKMSRQELKSIHGGEENNGCYYNFKHYEEGEEIPTIELLLHCTCHNQMLMCYLEDCNTTKCPQLQ
ncbi:bacteriocin-like protein [Elizabethkingia meningoseptica]|uniref:bacteriocin-like protein n=1 Tax=Elizabethkingia meningoseptica TaxID=238 RepID=UPI0011168F31|nr:hypothetical protein [Elizabethkingia meningoseptica]MEC4711247.1 hypothetical protein [Elizabethkingia meningoseptica]